MSVNVWSRARTLSRELGRPDIDPLGRLVFDDKGRRLVLPTSLSGTSALQRECSEGRARITTFAGVPVAEVAADVELLEEVDFDEVRVGDTVYNVASGGWGVVRHIGSSSLYTSLREIAHRGDPLVRSRSVGGVR